MKVKVNYAVISEAAKNNGITHRKIGKALGYTASWFSKARIDDRLIDYEDAEKLCNLVGVTLDEAADLTVNPEKDLMETMPIDYDKLYSYIQDRYNTIKEFSVIIAGGPSYLAECKHANRQLDLPKVNYICFLLGIQPDDIRYVEPEPEPEPEVIEIPEIDHEIIPVATDDEFHQWIKDAYMQLHKDNLHIAQVQSEAAEQLGKLLVEINNNLVRLRKLWEEH